MVSQGAKGTTLQQDMAIGRMLCFSVWVAAHPCTCFALRILAHALLQCVGGCTYLHMLCFCAWASVQHCTCVASVCDRLYLATALGQ
eukprot:11016366-Alexandrium_andersonii.AAC.1